MRTKPHAGRQHNLEPCGLPQLVRRKKVGRVRNADRPGPAGLFPLLERQGEEMAGKLQTGDS